jgi:NADP-dependent 3-hydroxy acid dehydrogenase YdfG
MFQKAIIPQMIERKSGHIINIGSTAAKEVYPNGNVYCASKHAVDALNQGMRMDLNPYGIRVGAIHPEWYKLHLVRFVLKEIRSELKMFIKALILYKQRILRILYIL